MNKRGASDRGSKWFAHLPIPKFSNSTPELKCTFSRGGGDSQLLMLSPEMLKSKISISAGGGGVGGQLLMLSPEMLKLKISISEGGGGWLPTFDVESKFAKI